MTGHKIVTPEDVRRWVTFAHGSPHYHYLAEVIASDPDLMRVLGRIPHTPQTNVLFAGVQYLLLQGHGPELAAFYPNLTDSPADIQGIDYVFKSFVLDNEETLVELGSTRYTQTNECRRCVALLPAMARADFDAFHLIDVGCSAGLNLAADRYRYRWGEIEWGGEYPVLLETDLRQGAPGVDRVTVLSRTGLDLNPIDARDSDHRLWLEALVWPENEPRRVRLRAALDQLEVTPVEFVAGNAVETLDDVLAGLPMGEPAVVMNSFALNQFTPDMRSQLEAVVERHRGSRPIHRVSLELFTSDNTWANLRIDGGEGYVDLGHAHPHGEWLELYA